MNFSSIHRNERLTCKHEVMRIYATKENSVNEDHTIKLPQAWKLILGEFTDEKKHQVIYKTQNLWYIKWQHYKHKALPWSTRGRFWITVAEYFRNVHANVFVKKINMTNDAYNSKCIKLMSISHIKGIGYYFYFLGKPLVANGENIIPF